MVWDIVKAIVIVGGVRYVVMWLFLFIMSWREL